MRRAATWLLVPCAIISISQFFSAVDQYSAEENRNPYLAESLIKNPYLGWQFPSPLPRNGTSHNENSTDGGPTFSWRSCFNKTVPSADRPVGCRESPAELGPAPSVSEDWIPDATMVRRMLLHGRDRNGNIFPPPSDGELCESIVATTGEEDGDIHLECIINANIRSLGLLNATTVIIPSNRSEFGEFLEVPAPRLMCLIYTMEGAHADRIRAMRETWAGGCDGFLVFSTKSDPRLPAISIEHDGPEAYDNMWQKIRSIWKFVAKHYLNDYDWFIAGGDDLFLLPYNLKMYLASLAHKDGADPKTREYFVGRRFKRNGNEYLDDYFNSGGAGYVLSRATLRRYDKSSDDAEHCFAKQRSSMEDVMMARCLRHLGIHFTNTRDSKGRERFHHFMPGQLFRGELESWVAKFDREWGTKKGKGCCAPDSVSFHQVRQPSLARHLHALLQDCGRGGLPDG